MSVTIGSGHEGNVRQQIDAYKARVKGGEMGALPSVLSLFFLTILFSVLNPYFFTQGNFANLLTQTATLMMLAMALVFVILIAEIDLSAGVTSGVAMALFILMTNKGGFDWRISIVAGLLLGTAIGAMIGFFVAKVGVPSFVVTLGLFLGFQGLQLALLGDGGLYRIEVPEIKAIMNDNLPAWMGWAFLAAALVIMTAINFYDRSVRSRNGLANRPISLMYTKLAIVGVLGAALVAMLNLNRSTSMKEISGVPIVVPIAITVLFLGTLLLDRTLFGRHLYAVGGNPEAARRAGIKVVKVRIIAPLELPMKCLSDSLTGSPTAARVVGPSPRSTGKFSLSRSINRVRAFAGVGQASASIDSRVSRVSSLTPPKGQSGISLRELSTRYPSLNSY